MASSHQSALSSLTTKQKLDELWRRGVVVDLLCHPVQKKMAADIKKSAGKKYVINSSRRLGKSFLLCCLAIEHALKNPNSQIKFASETQRSVKKIILPLFRQILETCPKQLRPKFHAHDGVFEFQNGSEIHIAGAALDQADSLRGTACDLALVDEAGFIDNLDYLIDSVLFPQTLTRPNARIILASTPPVSPDHPFVSVYMQQAMEAGNYSRYTIYDNPLITPEIITEFMKEAGGADTTTWRREYLAEVVTELSNAIFPEATQEEVLRDIVQEIDRPPFFLPIVAMDLGYVDFTGVLFGYYHFTKAKLVIEDEILVNKKNSGELVALIKAKERELWGNASNIMRVVDGNALAVADLNAIHDFRCRTPDKSDLVSNVNRVRIDLDQRRMIIHPRCVQLNAQVRFATWDKTRSNFSRSASGGHWDLCAALIYLAKHVDRTTNPIPASYGFNPYTDWGYPRSHKNNAVNAVRLMFPTLRPKK